MTTRSNKPSRAVLVILGVLVIAVLAALVLATRPHGAGPGPVAAESAAPTGPAGPGPAGTEAGVPVGWSHDQEGAEAAAAGFVRSTGLFVTSGTLTRRDVIGAIATPGYANELMKSVNDDLDELSTVLRDRGVNPADLVWFEYPLTVSSTMSTDGAEVRIWSVLVFGVRGESVARQIWTTSTLSLRWVDGDWKVAEWDSEQGPSPALTAAADVPPVDDVAAVAEWPVVGVGS